MAPLADLYRALGFDAVTTVLQSGNVVFASALRDPDRIAARLGEAIEAEFGFRPAIMMRTGDELRDAIDRNPFAGRSDIDPRRQVIVFMARAPANGGECTLASVAAGPEEVHLSGREVFVHYVNGIGRSKLSGAVIERALGVMGTARNWNTVARLAGLAARAG